MFLSLTTLLLLEAALLLCVLAAPKPLLKAKVSGPGYTVHARSPKACAHLCDRQAACDSANFEISSGKCKLFSRCAPVLIAFNSTNHIHFSKRPIVREPGWLYHEASDSCLKLVTELTDYAGADRLCDTRGGRLVSLTDQGINGVAAGLLSSSGAQYAWVGLTDGRREGDPLHTDGRRVSETGWFPVDQQSLRMDPRRNCWSLSDSGTWVEHHCKDREQFNICQIMPF